MKALLLVDLQNDFLPGGALGVEGSDKILPVVNELLSHSFDVVVATQDWHPADHGCFAETQGKKVGDIVRLAGLEQILWPMHCVQGTKGAELSADWDHQKVNKIFYKGTDANVDSYSAFYDNAHRKSTGLHEFLQSKGVKELYIGGLTTDYCVKYSVLDALKLKYVTYVILDACKAVNLQLHDEERALQEMLQNGAYFIRSNEIHD
jgi:nicotinamidase/pyrazinamidase